MPPVSSARSRSSPVSSHAGGERSNSITNSRASASNSTSMPRCWYRSKSMSQACSAESPSPPPRTAFESPASACSTWPFPNRVAVTLLDTVQRGNPAMNSPCSRRRSQATDERHQHSGGDHGAYNHRAGGKVQPQRREQAGCVPEHADAISLQMAAAFCVKDRKCRNNECSEYQIQAYELYRDGHGAAKQNVEPDPAKPLAYAEP